MTGYLLDTHTVLWWFTDSPRLSPAARTLLMAPATDLWVSAASAWEISIKARLGRLVDLPTITRDYAGLVARNGFRELPISTAHALAAGALTHPHGDPFDRMLAAQSIRESLPVITTDPALASLGAATVW